MFLTETANFAVGTALFVHAVFKAIVSYVHENKLPYETVKSGVDRATNSRTSNGGGSRNSAGSSLRVPDSFPTVVEIKRVLPKSCFQSQVSTSMYYCIKDFVQIFAAYAALSYAESLVSSFLLRVPLVLVYWAAQGTFFMGLFVMGHDCGHGSFSNYPLLNDAIGTVSHAFLLVPYYQWKVSHRNHHKYTANIDRDEVFYPVRRSQHNSNSRLLPGFGLGLGWIVYLTIGYKPRPVNHFNPWHPMFDGHLFGCLSSLGIMSAMLYIAYGFYAAYGLISLVIYYIVPLFLLGSYIVVITFLHHSEVDVPWYADEQWDFVRGQLSTVDRHYGFIHDIIHSIGTHQMHHMFTRIPHYHLEEATQHFRRAFPELVRVCNEPILPSFVRMFHKFEEQSVIDDNTKVYAFK
jgi:omega-3 fatty acid desaturase (delta-15 desaturase)